MHKIIVNKNSNLFEYFMNLLFNILINKESYKINIESKRVSYILQNYESLIEVTKNEGK